MVEWTSAWQPLAATDADPWALGWEFGVALATLLLASVTGWLAWTTRRLARLTGEEIVAHEAPCGGT